jgi:predicted acylesterase/phospholipase RssA
VTTLTVEEKISHIREAAMEEARARGNEIIDQHQKALEGVFKTHKQEAVMQADTRIKTETASARQQLNTVTSKGQLKLRRQLSRVQNELKNKSREGEIDFGRNIPPSLYALNFILKAYKDEKNYSN